MKAALIALAACGGTQAPPPPTSAPVAAAITLDPKPAPGDDVVATVDGHPIYASCVAAQASKDHLTREQALHACVDFELLARAAAKRGLTQDAEVVDAWKQAIASVFVDREFEHKLTKPEDVPTYAKVAEERTYRYRHDEYRGCWFARVEVPKTDDATAHATMDKVAALLAGRTGLLQADLIDAAAKVSAETGVPVAPAEVVPSTKERYTEPPFQAALWALPEVGRATPAFKDKYGWDVVVWTDVVPAADASDAEIVANLMPRARLFYFNAWVDGLGVKTEKNEDLLQQEER